MKLGTNSEFKILNSKSTTKLPRDPKKSQITYNYKITSGELQLTLLASLSLVKLNSDTAIHLCRKTPIPENFLNTLTWMETDSIQSQGNTHSWQDCSLTRFLIPPNKIAFHNLDPYFPRWGT